MSANKAVLTAIACTMALGACQRILPPPPPPIQHDDQSRRDTEPDTDQPDSTAPAHN